MKLVETPLSLSQAAGELVKAIGLGGFIVEASKIDSYDRYRLRMHRFWDADGARMQSIDTAIDWLHEIAGSLKDDILASELVVNRLAEKDKVIAELTQRIAALAAQVQGLVPYRMHYEMEFELKHGRTRDAGDDQGSA